jgi:hypothetical protein
LFVLEARLRISVRAHQAVQIGILLLVYGLVRLWLKASASALSKLDQRQYSRTITVIQLPVSQLTDAEADIQRPRMFELPVSEVKGVLSDTYDVEYIDIDAVSADDALEGLKREDLPDVYLNHVPLVDEDPRSAKPGNQPIINKVEAKRSL